MYKRIMTLTVLLFFTFFVIGCYAALNNEVFGYFKLTKAELIKKLGSNYVILPTGAEGSYEGYYFSDKGVNIVFDSKDNVDFIHCDDKIVFSGAKAGMNFEQIQKKLGKTKIIETWYETESNEAYKIEYPYGDDLILQFISFENDGTDSMVTIYRKPKP